LTILFEELNERITDAGASMVNDELACIVRGIEEMRKSTYFVAESGCDSYLSDNVQGNHFETVAYHVSLAFEGSLDERIADLDESKKCKSALTDYAYDVYRSTVDFFDEMACVAYKGVVITDYDYEARTITLKV